jgi:hypothetical protein
MPPLRVTPLSDRIRAHLEDTGQSIRTLALRSVDPATGRQLTAQWITDVLSGRVSRMPDAWRLDALAAGLRCDPDSVKAMAITQWIGWELADVQVGAGERLIFRVPEDWTAEHRARFAEELLRSLNTAHSAPEGEET